jgi:hypothetical protein
MGARGALPRLRGRGVATRGALPRLRGRGVATRGALPRLRGRGVATRGALPRLRGRGAQGDRAALALASAALCRSALQTDPRLGDMMVTKSVSSRGLQPN